MDEFTWIDRLRPLTRGDPRALALRDDAAVLPGRPGYDLIISTDSMVEGVHWLAGEDPYVIARRLLRVSLSDLAAKAAEPFGYFLDAAWSHGFDTEALDRFIDGLREEGARFDVSLLGGDTVTTSGPPTFTATVLGWAQAGRAVLRSGAKEGDACVVLGTIGDGWLGLRAARGEIDDEDGYLATRFRRPEPLFAARSLLVDYASACADVSDGLLADAMHIGEASGLGLTVDLDRAPLSAQALCWTGRQPDVIAARLALATGGDDYALVCAVTPALESAFFQAAFDARLRATSVGRFVAGDRLRLSYRGQAVEVAAMGWRH